MRATNKLNMGKNDSVMKNDLVYNIVPFNIKKSSDLLSIPKGNGEKFIRKILSHPKHFNSTNEEKPKPESVPDKMEEFTREAKEFLEKRDIKYLQPIFYLMDKADAGKIKDMADDLGIEPNKFLKSLFKTTFRDNFHLVLKETLKEYIVDKKITLEKAKEYLFEEEIKEIEEIIK